MSRIQEETLKKMIKAIAETRSDEYDCDLCFEKLEKFVEMDFFGEDAAKHYPMVKHHLDSCVCCAEEYQALIDALSGLESDPTLAK